MTNIDEMSINAIRVLSADAIQKANSGHPGLPLGTAPTAYELWTNHMNYNPADPDSFFLADMVQCFFTHCSIYLELAIFL